MAEIKILNSSVVIHGNSFEDCKAEYDRICKGVHKDFKVAAGLENLTFSNMTQSENSCTAIFRTL